MRNRFIIINLLISTIRIVTAIILSAAFFGYIIHETYADFSRLRGLIGITAFSIVGFFMSGNYTYKVNFKFILKKTFFYFRGSQKDNLEASNLWWNFSVPIRNHFH